MKHAPRVSSSPLQIRIRLNKADEGMALFEMSNAMVEPKEDPERPITLVTSDGFGSQLLAAFARQLEGKMERVQEDGRYRLTLYFPIRALSSGEQRTSPPGDADEDDPQSEDAER